MKIIYVFTLVLAALVAAQEKKVVPNTLKQRDIVIKCIKPGTIRTPVDYPEVKDEVKLDFKSIAELKDQVAKKNQAIEKTIPPAQILSLDALKLKFGDKMKAGFNSKAKMRVFSKLKAGQGLFKKGE